MYTWASLECPTCRVSYFGLDRPLLRLDPFRSRFIAYLARVRKAAPATFLLSAGVLPDIKGMDPLSSFHGIPKPPLSP